MNPSKAVAAARLFEIAAVYVPGTIIYSWVPGVVEAKSWGTHIRLGTTVSDAASPSMLLLALLFSCYAASLRDSAKLLQATRNSSVAGCRCLSVAAAALR